MDNKTGKDIMSVIDKDVNSAEAQVIDYLKQALASLGDLTRNVQQPETILSYKGASIWRKGNLSLIIGGEGSRKTFLVTMLIIAFLQEDEWAGFSSDVDEKTECKLLWIDTEQSEGDFYEAVRRVNRGMGVSENENISGFKFSWQRPYGEAERLQMTKALIEHFKPKVTVIDGVADLMLDTNSLSETTEIKDWLLKTTSDNNNHILCVLHTNPNSEKARGHIGSELPRKAETVMLTQAHGEYTTIDFPKCRKKKPEPFTFRINADGLPELCDTPKGIMDKKKADMELVYAAFEGAEDGLEYNEITSTLLDLINADKRKRKQKEIKIGTAKTRLSRYVAACYIRQDENKRYYSNCFKDENGKLVIKL